MSNPSLPSARAPVVDGDRRIQQVWLRFLSDLWIRTGRFEDNVNGSNRELDVYSSGDVAVLRQQVEDNEILHSMGF